MSCLGSWCKRKMNAVNKKSRIIVCGGRHFDDYACLESVMAKVMSDLGLKLPEIEIVSGHCQGADQLGETYAERHGISCKVFPAQWEVYGRAAGPVRNSEMIKYAAESEVPVVVAFVSPRSRGTMDTVKKAKKQGFRVYVTYYERE